ncbi:hypothetical protein S83_001553, partial [Arachis hypogaea]
EGEHPIEEAKKKATMCREKSRNIRKIVSLVLMLKSSLVVGDCWLALLLDLINVAGMTSNAYNYC